MELKFKRKNKTVIVLVSGEIDHHTSKEIRRQTESALSQMCAKNVIYGFEQVTFMDSSGIGMMIGRYKQLQMIGGRIAIVGANEKIQEIIRLSGLIQLLPFFHTFEEAIHYAEGRETNAV